jgi:hypothetical protein
LVFYGSIPYVPDIHDARKESIHVRTPTFAVHAIDLDVRPLAGRIGAQIDDIRLAGNLPDAAIAAIEAAL